MVEHYHLEPIYLNGVPMYWRDEVTGALPAAVKAFLAGVETPDQFQLVRAYCEYWVHAPCWESGPEGEPLTTLREIIRHIATHAGLSDWVMLAVGEGLDPF